MDCELSGNQMAVPDNPAGACSLPLASSAPSFCPSSFCIIGRQPFSWQHDFTKTFREMRQGRQQASTYKDQRRHFSTGKGENGS